MRGVGGVRSPKPSPKTDGLPYQRLWTDLKGSALLQCRLLIPLGSREPDECCLGSIFPSQHRSAQVKSKRRGQAGNCLLRPRPRS